MQHSRPTALRIAEGNLSCRPLPQNEPQAERGIPATPAYLSQKAQAVWMELAPLLLQLGTLSLADGVALEALCNQIVYLREAHKSIDTDGVVIQMKHGPIKNPAVTVADTCLKHIRSLLGEFGLTPAARSRIKSNNPEHGNLLDQIVAVGLQIQANEPY